MSSTEIIPEVINRIPVALNGLQFGDLTIRLHVRNGAVVRAELSRNESFEGQPGALPPVRARKFVVCRDNAKAPAAIEGRG